MSACIRGFIIFNVFKIIVLMLREIFARKKVNSFKLPIFLDKSINGWLKMNIENYLSISFWYKIVFFFTKIKFHVCEYDTLMNDTDNKSHYQLLKINKIIKCINKFYWLKNPLIALYQIYASTFKFMISFSCSIKYTIDIVDYTLP